MTATSRLLAVPLRRAWSAVRRRVAGPDLYLLGCACFWLDLFWVVSPSGYQALHAAPLLAVKATWLYPAIAGVLVPPLGWLLPWRQARTLARLYKAGYWGFLAAGTLAATPGIPPFWGVCALNVLVIFWLIAREGAAKLRADAGRG